MCASIRNANARLFEAMLVQKLCRYDDCQHKDLLFVHIGTSRACAAQCYTWLLIKCQKVSSFLSLSFLSSRCWASYADLAQMGIALARTAWPCQVQQKQTNDMQTNDMHISPLQHKL